MIPYPSNLQHSDTKSWTDMKAELILRQLTLTCGFTSYTNTFSFSSAFVPVSGVAAGMKKCPWKGGYVTLGVCKRVINHSGVVLVAELHSISLPIVWSHLWRIVDTSGLGERVWSAAAVNTTVVTAEVSGTLTLWLKNGFIYLIPYTEVCVSLSLTQTHVWITIPST